MEEKNIEQKNMEEIEEMIMNKEFLEFEKIKDEKLKIQIIENIKKRKIGYTKHKENSFIYDSNALEHKNWRKKNKRSNLTKKDYETEYDEKYLEERCENLKKYLNENSNENKILIKNGLMFMKQVFILIDFLSSNANITYLIIEQKFLRIEILSELIQGIEKYSDTILNITFPEIRSNFLKIKENYLLNKIFHRLGEVLLRNREINKQKETMILIKKDEQNVNVLNNVPKPIIRLICNKFSNNSCSSCTPFYSDIWNRDHNFKLFNFSSYNCDDNCNSLIKKTKKKTWFELIENNVDPISFQKKFSFSLNDHYAPYFI